MPTADHVAHCASIQISTCGSPIRITVDPIERRLRYKLVPSIVPPTQHPALKIAVIGSGVSGLSAAWLLSRAHDVTVYEQADRPGGHANTVVVASPEGNVPVDTGFIVFNRVTYPNFSAMLAELEVPTQLSDMSFAASLNGGRFEYAGGSGLDGLFAQRGNLLRPRFHSMLAGVRKFYRNAVQDAQAPNFERLSLGDYLEQGDYSDAFRDDHLLPMASAIWSATKGEMLSFPALAFIRFHANHGLLQITGRPMWETVEGGSITYVRRLLEQFSGTLRLGTAVVQIERDDFGVRIVDGFGQVEQFDHVVIASHANQALAMLAKPTAEEECLLGTFRYQRNHAVLHSDPSFMPRRRPAWACWNYIGGQASDGDDACFTYWMNRLQSLPGKTPYFVTLNPQRDVLPDTLHHTTIYDHPLFDADSISAQRGLWELQGKHRTWFCGAYFGAGFHEDGLQAGLAVAEQLGGVMRPWTVANPSGRIILSPHNAAPHLEPAQ